MKTSIAACLLLLPGLQDEKAVADAVKATRERGSFSFKILPVADVRDALPETKRYVAGGPLVGEVLKDGTFHVKDANWELYGRNSALLLHTADGWTPATDVARDLLEKIQETYGADDMARKNVTEAKAAFQKYLALQHLAARSLPPSHLLSRLDTDFKAVKKTSTETLDGRKVTIYDGELKENAATLLLVGPYGQSVKDGSLQVVEAVGKGKIWIGADGLVRRTLFKAAGKYVSLDTESKQKRTTPAAVEITADLQKVGETELKVPQEVQDKLAAMQPEEEKKK